MRKISERTLAFRVDEELFKDVKIKLAMNGLTLRSYVLNLIKKDLYDDQVDLEMLLAKQAACKLKNDAEELINILEVYKK